MPGRRLTLERTNWWRRLRFASRGVSAWLWSPAVLLCLLSGIEAGRLVASGLECNACFYVSPGVLGKPWKQGCNWGVCKDGTTNVWCYGCQCQACKKKGLSCSGGCAVTCPSNGACNSNGVLQAGTPSLCVNSCCNGI